ncbi:MAG: hypothetical protein GY936_06805 [Ignavibacteriae bacterium]|nr:hypothetical protein [Ignavibacteriota bacterium]
MKFFVLIITLHLAWNVSFAQTFRDFLSNLDSTEITYRQFKIDSFMNSMSQFPITEDTLAHFVYKGSGANPSVAGDFSQWDPQFGHMINVNGTDFWYRTEIFKSNARLEYKIVFDKNTWTVDSLNFFVATGGFDINSELRMPNYIPPKEINFYSDIIHGTIIDTVLYSNHLKNSRNISIYLPPKYSETKNNYSIVLVHDGEEYIRLAKMNNILDYLISRNMIQPVIVVFVPAVNRSSEYVDNGIDSFKTFIIEDVMEMVDSKYRTKKQPEDRLVMGSSAGANIALWIAMNHSDSFGIVGVFSPYIKSEIIEHFQNSKKTEMRLFILHGSYDHLQQIHSSVNNFLQILDYKSYQYNYLELPESHNYSFWRAHIADLLRFAFPNQN